MFGMSIDKAQEILANFEIMSKLPPVMSENQIKMIDEIDNPYLIDDIIKQQQQLAGAYQRFESQVTDQDLIDVIKNKISRIEEIIFKLRSQKKVLLTSEDIKQLVAEKDTLIKSVDWSKNQEELEQLQAVRKLLIDKQKEAEQKEKNAQRKWTSNKGAEYKHTAQTFGLPKQKTKAGMWALWKAYNAEKDMQEADLKERLEQENKERIVSGLLLGKQAGVVNKEQQEEAVRQLNKEYQLGSNALDSSWDYYSSESEHINRQIIKDKQQQAYQKWASLEMEKASQAKANREESVIGSLEQPTEQQGFFNSIFKRKPSDEINEEKAQQRRNKSSIEDAKKILKESDDRLLKLIGEDKKEDNNKSFWGKVGAIASGILKLVTVFGGFALWKWLSSDSKNPENVGSEEPQKLPEVEKPKVEKPKVPSVMEMTKQPFDNWSFKGNSLDTLSAGWKEGIGSGKVLGIDVPVAPTPKPNIKAKPVERVLGTDTGDIEELIREVAPVVPLAKPVKETVKPMKFEKTKVSSQVKPKKGKDLYFKGTDNKSRKKVEEIAYNEIKESLLKGDFQVRKGRRLTKKEVTKKDLEDLHSKINSKVLELDGTPDSNKLYKKFQSEVEDIAESNESYENKYQQLKELGDKWKTFVENRKQEFKPQKKTDSVIGKKNNLGSIKENAVVNARKEQLNDAYFKKYMAGDNKKELQWLEMSDKEKEALVRKSIKEYDNIVSFENKNFNAQTAVNKTKVASVTGKVNTGVNPNKLQQPTKVDIPKKLDDIVIAKKPSVGNSLDTTHTVPIGIYRDGLNNGMMV